MGDSGSGKTYSLRTLIDIGVTPFVLFTEPGMETLGDLPEGAWHWKYVRPATQSWGDILAMTKKVNEMSFDNLTKTSDPYRKQYTGMLDTLNACNNFVCDCHKTPWGDVGSWSTDRAFVLDSLSGLGDMAMANTVGGKPTRSPAEWGVAQNTIRAILSPLTTATRCTFILIGHLARERDEVTGGTQVMVHTLGQKLAPDLPKMFSDVILTVRLERDWYWDLIAHNTALKTRNLKYESKLKPSFKPLLEEWLRKGGAITPSTTAT